MEKIIKVIKNDFGKDIEFVYFHFMKENNFSMNYYFYHPILKDKVPSQIEDENNHELLSDIFENQGFNVYCHYDGEYAKYTHTFSPMIF